jgi:xanthine/uracil permease
VQRAYLASTRLLSAALLVLGVAMVVSALARGGGALALGVVLGALFALVGAARLWLGRRGEARSSRLGRPRRVRYPRGGER